MWQFEESFYHHHQYLLRALHKDHVTPPRSTHPTHQTFTARTILPTHGSSPFNHDLYVTDQVAALMLCPVLPVGASSLTFSQAATYQNNHYTVDMHLQPFRSLSHVPTPPITTQPRTIRRTKRHQLNIRKISCPFGTSPLHLLCPLTQCKNFGLVTKTLRAHAARDNWLTHPFALSISGHTPSHICSDLVILRLTPFTGPCISIRVDPALIISNLLPLIHHISDITAASDLWYITNVGAPLTNARHISQPVADFAPVLYMRQAGRLCAGSRNLVKSITSMSSPPFMFTYKHPTHREQHPHPHVHNNLHLLYSVPVSFTSSCDLSPHSTQHTNISVSIEHFWYPPPRFSLFYFSVMP